MFRAVFPSIIRILILYIQHQVYIKLKFEKWVKLLLSVHIGCSIGKPSEKCRVLLTYYMEQSPS
jgi:hypothetical protein